MLSRNLLGVPLLLLLVAGANPVAPVAANVDPCNSAEFLPEPPGGRPKPTAIGSVVEGANADPVSGATLNVYRCEGSQSVWLASSLTDAAGEYQFVDIDHGDDYFYIAAEMSGPLSGKSPSEGSSASSALFDGTVEAIQFHLEVE